ncbi:MAG: polymer-forming cytoskeletal protein [Candidatus Acidiferrales bacterium]|jgi:cytoskeletal protein CcmA (bactofilin family)
MWNNTPGSQPPAPRGDSLQPESRVSRDVATLGPGLTLKGELTGHEDLYLDCKFEGPVNFGGHRVTIGRSSNVEGDVVAREAILYGKLNGDLNAHDRMEIKKGGSFTGDLTTGRISIEEGAFFKGHIEVDPSSKPVGTDLGTILQRGEKS